MNRTEVSSQSKPNAFDRPRNILDLSAGARQQFLQSFDMVLCDCDGVVWTTMQQPIKDVGKGVEFLRRMGKRIVFVTNNSIRSPEDYAKKFETAGIKVNLEDIFHPALCIVMYLKKIKFDGLIYCIATNTFKDFLTNAGFQIIDGPNKILEENFADLAKNVFDKSPVRAVIVDIDFNLSAPKIIRAHLYLKHPDCILIGGAADMVTPFGDTDIVGPGPYIKIIEMTSKRKAAILGKPGKELGELVKETCRIQNTDRILFIGDMLETDINFGKMCGFQTLVVLTGATKTEDLNLLAEDNEIPDFYAHSLVDFSKLLEEDKEIK